QQGADVRYHDPFVPKYREDGHEYTSVPLSDEEISSADAVVIVTDHSKVDYQRVVHLAKVVVDTRNATAKLTRGKGRIVSLASTGAHATVEHPYSPLSDHLCNRHRLCGPRLRRLSRRNRQHVAVRGHRPAKN